MEVIQFPGAKQLTEKVTSSDLDIKKVTNVETKLFLGPIAVTCRNCATKTKFSSEQMIFRSLEFYCTTCGTLHKVVNPAFAEAELAQRKVERPLRRLK